jgi:hypothetical protein
MSFSPFNPFQIDIPGRKLKREVSDAPDPRTSCQLHCQNLKISSQFLVRSSKFFLAGSSICIVHGQNYEL